MLFKMLFQIFNRYQEEHVQCRIKHCKYMCFKGQYLNEEVCISSMGIKKIPRMPKLKFSISLNFDLWNKNSPV